MLSELRLENFRCFEYLSASFPNKGAVIIGDNAQGKTSILEAICILVRLHSPRTQKQRSLILEDETYYGVAGLCWENERVVRHMRGGLKMQIDGEEVKKQSDYFKNGGLLVWMGNTDLELVIGRGEVRRRFIDFLGFQLGADYRNALSRYRKALKNRNLLLKSSHPNLAQIEAFDKILIMNGDFLSQARSSLLERLSPLVSDAQSVLSQQQENVQLIYRQGAPEGMATALDLAKEKDFRRGQTSSGIHRDDFTILLNDKEASEYGSEGQQRSLALALKLSQGALLQKQCEKYPIYLLDDIFGELDAHRRNAVLESIPEQSQMFITTTNIDWWKKNNRNVAVLRLEDRLLKRVMW